MTIDDKMDSRVGHGATSILEKMLKLYIDTYTVDGKYTGLPERIVQYEQLRRYNEKD